MSKFENMTFENLLVEVPEPEVIKDLRLDLGLTAAQCAKLAGLTDSALWVKYENGNRSPNKQTWSLFLLASGKHPAFNLQAK
ncbi:helix-turn-helix domain-containing protein [Acinetobacter baumannii]